MMAAYTEHSWVRAYADISSFPFPYSALTVVEQVVQWITAVEGSVIDKSELFTRLR